MSRVESVGRAYNATDNLYDGFSAYKKLSALGKPGKVVAEIGGKTSNAVWLYGKLRTGYTVIDIGYDYKRATRSSSYAMERGFLFMWETRNIWKLPLHE